MSSAHRTFVVVGGGVTAGSAVETLRADGFDGRIVLVGEEPHVPYERPPLSKDYLRGEQPRDDLFVRSHDWYSEHGVEVRVGVRATSIDPGARLVELEGGERIGYDAALLATGGRPRHLGESSGRVHYLRTIEDADRLRARLGPGRRLVVVGAGFIGSEVAASARELGTDVTVVDLFHVPLERAVGEHVGRIVGRIHEEHGVAFVMGDPVEAVEEVGDAVRVRTVSGTVVEGDAAAVGVAIAPNVALAERAGLHVDDGIVVDELCRTSAPGVYAAGDVAKHFHPLFGRHIRVEHFDNALKQGAAAARSMLGKAEPYADPHWFWSDQYEVNLQHAGFAEGALDVIVRGSLVDRSFVAFSLKDGVLVACIGMGRGRDVRRAMKLMSARARPDPAALADEDVDLRSLLPSR